MKSAFTITVAALFLACAEPNLDATSKSLSSTEMMMPGHQNNQKPCHTEMSDAKNEMMAKDSMRMICSSDSSKDSSSGSRPDGSTPSVSDPDDSGDHSLHH